MILTGQGIKEQRNSGSIVIEPFKEENVQPNSYDLTLGNFYYPLYKIDGIDYEEYNLNDLSFGGFFDDRWLFNMADFYESVTIPGGGSIITHTNECFGAVQDFAPQIATKSTLARYGIDVCGSAGFGDVGYVNKWTLEIFNRTHFPVTLIHGQPVCQVYFTELIGEQVNKYTGTYNAGENTWKPQDMKPKAMRDLWLKI